MTIEGLLGRKLGTTQVFDSKGRLRGVTAVEVGPCFVTDIRTPEKNGYSAIQIGYQEDRRLNKPEAGHLNVAQVPRYRGPGPWCRTSSADTMKITSSAMLVA